MAKDITKLRKNTHCISGSQAYLACDLGNKNKKESHKILLVSSLLFQDSLEQPAGWGLQFQGLSAALTHPPL